MHCLYATAGSGNCFKPQLLMHQLDIPFRTEWVDVLRGENLRPEYLSVSPTGAVPCLQLPGGATIAEANAMLWLLAEGTELMPATPYDRAKTVQWMLFEQTEIDPNLAPARFYTTEMPEKATGKAFEIDTWRETAQTGLARVERHLTLNPFLVGGRYSIADIAVFGHVHLMEEAGIEMRTYPAIASWCANVAGTSGFVGMGDLSREAA